MRFAIYSRKSKFTGKGESIENQIEMCKDYISTHFPDDKPDISIYEDEGFSGKNLNRPKFQEMMVEENKNPFDYIVVYRLDRISRNVGDFATLIDKLNDHSTSFICIKEQFDTSTPMGRAMMNIAAVFAQLERETIAERVKDNMYMLARDGRWLGGTTPLGYKSVKTYLDEEKKSCYRLEENTEETPLVKLIFDKFIEFRSLNKLTTYLLNHDIKTRKGSNFAVSTLRRIIINPVYCVADELSYNYFINQQKGNLCFTKEDCNGEFGFTSYNKTDNINNTLLNCEDWIVAVGKHKGIIESQQWINAQFILIENADSKSKFKQSHNPTALLSGILFCQCGSYMRPKYYKVNKQGERPFAYMCELKEVSHKKKCEENNLNGIIADKIVCDTLLDYEIEGNLFNKYINNFNQNGLNDEIKSRITQITKSKNKRQKQIQTYIQTIGQGNINESTLSFINIEIEKLNNEINELQDEIKKLEQSLNDSAEIKNHLKTLEGTLKYFKNNFDNLSVENKRNFIRKCIDKVIWQNGELHIFIKDR